MSHVIAAPQTMTAAASDLASIASTLDQAHAAAASTTVAVTPAAADEVSMAVAHLFSQHAERYQAVAREAAAFEGQFVENLKSGAAAYTSIEDAIVSLLRGLETGIESLGSGYFSLVLQFLEGAFGWIPADLEPPILGVIIFGIPAFTFLIIPFFALLFAIGIINGIIAAITGQLI